MKNNSLSQTVSNDQIRQNRLKMRQKIKLNTSASEKKDKLDEINTTTSIAPHKPQRHVEVQKLVGLVNKQFIQGQFQDSYELLQKIGEGAHATVYRCIEKITGNNYAVKITKQNDDQLMENSKVQFKILKNLDHPNIMKAEAFYIDTQKMTTYLVCQLCSYPELGIYLRNRKTKTVSEAQATTIIKAVLQTLQYLHKQGVCHRDIKPENILYDSENKIIKVIDFDCAKNRRQHDLKFQMWTKTGTLFYQAPEYFKNTIYEQKVDIWALGIIAYELVTGNMPFKGNYYHRMIKMIIEDNIQIDSLQISHDFKLLLKKLLQKNPLQRVSASQCLRLPAILKSQQINLTIMLDDFDVQLQNSTNDSPRSCADLMNRRSSQTLIHNKSSQNKQMLKYTFFVTQI